MSPRLDLVTSENVREACALKVAPEQEEVVAPVAMSLAEAYARPDVAWPRLVYDADQLVGAGYGRLAVHGQIVGEKHL